MDPLQIWVRNMDRKKEIRAKILKMRQALPKEEVREKSLRIMRRIEETETFKNADNLLAYIDFLQMFLYVCSHSCFQSKLSMIHFRNFYQNLSSVVT